MMSASFGSGDLAWRGVWKDEIRRKCLRRPEVDIDQDLDLGVLGNVAIHIRQVHPTDINPAGSLPDFIEQWINVIAREHFYVPRASPKR